MASEGDGSGSAEVRVKFTTSADKYKVTNTSIAVPARFTRKGLSEVINHLLALDPVVPFDFLINGTFLRSSLRKYMRKNGLSGESVLDIEYVPAVQAPEGDIELKHPDWVSAVAAAPSVVVTACYDGAIRAYDSHGSPIATVTAHKKAVKCTAVTGGAEEGAPCHVLSGAKDGVVKLWTLSDGAFAQKATCIGHAGGVESVAFAPGGTQFCSGSWDGIVNVWSAAGAGDGDESKDESGPRKRARTGQATSSSAVKTLAPSVQLKGHAHVVNSVEWPAPNTIVSGSQDHSIRLWDLTGGALVESTAMHGNKVVNSVSTAANGVTFASAHPDHIVRVWDSRASGTSVVKLALRGHTAWVSSVAWQPGSSSVLVSSSYDGSLHVWDIRSSTPLHKLAAHGDKALSVAWQPTAPPASGEATALPQRFISGGADNLVRFFRLPRTE